MTKTLERIKQARRLNYECGRMIVMAASALEDFDCTNVARELWRMRDDLLTAIDSLDGALIDLEENNGQDD